MQWWPHSASHPGGLAGDREHPSAGDEAVLGQVTGCGGSLQRSRDLVHAGEQQLRAVRVLE